ncbi:rhodanese-like domain-containing protein [Tengunoibacter tsumagoiensis]|uniref:Rhodanese n=1 Tax=Tengunoibacter tsumagoiensis TaxID=2014871 RepID=A0A402A7Y9_9CHLR|nr:rhodanese-like domain-containing protein [Tengunoibacter tsumagoiensis]GCE15274.1 rhodanese [Tengunoibacter tsumagoiensis]
MTQNTPVSLVLEIPAAPSKAAHQHFFARLAVETDVSDVMGDLQRGYDGFVLIDARSTQDFEECHIPGAINLPYRTITADTMKAFSQDKPLIIYCWSPACNAATKAAARLSALGFQVKEMLGGIEYWRREGGAVEGILKEGNVLVRAGSPT